MSIYRYILVVICAFISLHSAAQVSFTNPLINNGNSFVVSGRGPGNQSDPVPVPGNGAGTNTLSFEVTLYRPINSNTGGYVSIHTGKSSSDYSPTEIAVTSPVDNSLWTSANDGNGTLSSSYEQQILTGVLTGSAYIVNNNTGFFAVYHDNLNSSTLVSSQVYLQVLPPDYSENPLSVYIPFPDKEIGPDQCVPYGVRPKTIQGRILAGNWGGTFLAGTGWDSEYARYIALSNSLGVKPFASDSEKELVVWQYSYDMYDWIDVFTDGQENFLTNLEPSHIKPITKVTYFRRVSTHIQPTIWNSGNRDFWYTSNIVTISPTAPVPSTSQTAFKSCGNNVTVGANADPAIASYNWSAPYDGWTISDGVQAPFSTYNNVRSFVTTKNSNIVVHPARNAAPGDYIVSFSANGTCGPQSADNHLTITIDYSGTSAPTSGYFSLSSGATYCNPYYDLYTSPVAGATSYEATLNDGSYTQGYFDPNVGRVVFPFRIAGPSYGVSAQIVAIGTCGPSSAYYVSPRNFSKPPIGCDPQPQVKAYPNPAVNSLTLEAKSDKSICYIYNDKGIIILTIPLDKGGASQSVDVSTIPNGLYNIVIEAPDRQRSLQHIVVQH